VNAQAGEEGPVSSTGGRGESNDEEKGKDAGGSQAGFPALAWKPALQEIGEEGSGTRKNKKVPGRKKKKKKKTLPDSRGLRLLDAEEKRKPETEPSEIR